MWADFDEFAHDMLALYGRVKKHLGKSESGGDVWGIDHAALGAYIDAGGPHVDDYEPHEILDGVLAVANAMNG